MLQSSWDEIEKIYNLPQVDPDTIHQFQLLKTSQTSHTKGDKIISHLQPPRL